MTTKGDLELRLLREEVEATRAVLAVHADGPKIELRIFPDMPEESEYLARLERLNAARCAVDEAGT